MGIFELISVLVKRTITSSLVVLVVVVVVVVWYCLFGSFGWVWFCLGSVCMVLLVGFDLVCFLFCTCVFWFGLALD